MGWKNNLVSSANRRTAADDGERWIDPTVKLARLEQELPIEGDATVFDWVSGGLTMSVNYLCLWGTASAETEADLARMARVQQALDT